MKILNEYTVSSEVSCQYIYAKTVIISRIKVTANETGKVALYLIYVHILLARI